jgi:hypothetical protein
MGTLSLPTSGRVFVDANVVIYAVELKRGRESSRCNILHRLPTPFPPLFPLPFQNAYGRSRRGVFS